MESKLEELVYTKRFDELSLLEKEYVAKTITEKEYIKMHLLLTSLNPIFDKEMENIELDSQIEENLKNAFRKKHKEHVRWDFKTLLASLFQPVYKPVFAFGIIALFVFLFLPSTQKQKTLAEQKILKDTSKKLIMNSVATFESKQEHLNITKKDKMVQNNEVVKFENQASKVIDNRKKGLQKIHIDFEDSNKSICFNLPLPENDNLNQYLRNTDLCMDTKLIVPDIYSDLMLNEGLDEETQ
jgi:hypothetical protein